MKNDGRFKKGERRSPNTEFKKGEHWREKQPFWDYDWLYNKYHIEKLSTTEIAKLSGCRHTNISYWLNKLGIKSRNISETRKIKYWGASGIDNPMWNKKGELNKNWKGGVTAERQSFYMSQEWKNACKEVWKRDNAKCQRCGLEKETDVPFHIHHIVSFSNKDLRADINNLILMCEPCHQWIHSRKNVNKEFIKNG